MGSNAPLVHVTTVHARRDVRIFVKEAQSLRALGRSVILVVADGLGDERGGPEEVSFVDVGRPQGRLARAALTSWRAMRAAMRLGPAIVHFHDPELIPMALALKALGHKVVYDVHEDVPQQILSKHWIPLPLRHAVAAAASAMERVAKWSFDAFVPATSHIASKFPPGRTVVVQNFPIPSELTTRAIPYAQRPPHIAYVGGISVSRGAHEMMSALALLNDRPQARIDLAGTMIPASLEGELRAMPGWSKVIYRGQVDRGAVAEVLGATRAGLVTLHPTPAYVDALPVKLFEYMAAGLPVIASDFPLWREIVSGAGCGLLVDPHDPAVIAGAMRWILDHPDEAEIMGRKGQEAVASTYSWPGEARKLLELYDRLLPPAQGARHAPARPAQAGQG